MREEGINLSQSIQVEFLRTDSHKVCRCRLNSNNLKPIQIWMLEDSSSKISRQISNSSLMGALPSSLRSICPQITLKGSDPKVEHSRLFNLAHSKELLFKLESHSSSNRIRAATWFKVAHRISSPIIKLRTIKREEPRISLPKTRFHLRISQDSKSQSSIPKTLASLHTQGVSNNKISQCSSSSKLRHHQTTLRILLALECRVLKILLQL